VKQGKARPAVEAFGSESGMVQQVKQSPLKAVVFDFDGVILESVDVKTEAFRRLFQDYPDQMDRIVEFHRHNTGLSRYEKFRIIYRDFLKKPLCDKEVKELDRAFSELVVGEVISCPFVPGAQEFLDYTACHWPLFVVSGTPHDELRAIVQARGLAGYFRQVLGSPNGKEVLLSEVVRGNGLDSSGVVFIGDSLVDLRAADAVGVFFIGRAHKVECNPFPESVAQVVIDLRDLMCRWPRIMAQLSQQRVSR
jgi:phosphoglycolate phosphatase-like HAD superfamily hydrolase